jgi:hypothetical protein
MPTPIEASIYFPPHVKQNRYYNGRLSLQQTAVSPPYHLLNHAPTSAPSIISHISQLQRDKEAAHAADAHAQSIEFLQGQIQALRSAFTTLSEVIVGEMEDLRAEVRR